MSLYKEIQPILPYLSSIRKLKTYLSFDIYFPSKWVIPKKYVDESKVIENESTVIDMRFFSFVSEINDSDIAQTTTNLLNIIKYNKEKEEKEKLFENKVKELKDIFDKQSLTELKDLKFNLITNSKLFVEDEQNSELSTNVEQPKSANRGRPKAITEPEKSVN